MANLLLTSISSFSMLSYKPSTDTWMHNKEEIDLSILVAYPDTINTGWAAFTPGMPPDWRWDETLGKPGKPPTSDHKRGFSIEVKTEANGDMTWSGAGYGQCAAIEELMEDVSSSADSHRGQIPVIEYIGSESKKVGKGSTRIPKFKIIDWVDPAFPPWMLQSANDTPF